MRAHHVEQLPLLQQLKPTPPAAAARSATTTTREALPRLTFPRGQENRGAIITRSGSIRVGRKLNTISSKSRESRARRQRLERERRQRRHHHDQEDAKLDAVKPDDHERHPGQRGNALDQ
jgi:hypothetical protein